MKPTYKQLNNQYKEVVFDNDFDFFKYLDHVHAIRFVQSYPIFSETPVLTFDEEIGTSLQIIGYFKKKRIGYEDSADEELMKYLSTVPEEYCRYNS